MGTPCHRESPAPGSANLRAGMPGICLVWSATLTGKGGRWPTRAGAARLEHAARDAQATSWTWFTARSANRRGRAAVSHAPGTVATSSLRSASAASRGYHTSGCTPASRHHRKPGRYYRRRYSRPRHAVSPAHTFRGHRSDGRIRPGQAGPHGERPARRPTPPGEASSTSVTTTSIPARAVGAQEWHPTSRRRLARHRQESCRRVPHLRLSDYAGATRRGTRGTARRVPGA